MAATPLTLDGSIRVLGRTVLDIVLVVGEVTLLGLRSVKAILAQPQRRRTLVTQLYNIGYLSLPVVVITGLSIGLVIAVQGYATLRRFSAENAVGSMTAFTMITQLAPATTALMVAGRVGSAIAAEIGAMKVTEQIDALRIMGTDPNAYLVAPRLIACVCLMPCLTAIAALAGIYGSAVLCLHVYGIDEGAFWFRIREIVWGWNVITGLAKTPVFGAIIALVACRAGLRTEGGASGVGRSCTEGVVTASLLVLTVNFVLTVVTEKMRILIFGV